MNKTKKLLLGACLLSTSFAHAQFYKNIDLPQELENATVGVRLTDYARYTNVIPGLSTSEAQDLSDKWNRFVDDAFELEKALSVFFHDKPKTNGAVTILPLTAFGELENGSRYAFIQANVHFDGKDFSVEPIDTIMLDDTQFEFDVSLKERKVVIADQLNNLKMVVPLGVGAFDEGVLNDEVTLLTPRFDYGFLDQWTAISERKKPRYFAGKPFLRITTAENPANGHTPIGFHVQPNLDKFVRAFDSHGCMRMPLDDLNMVHDLLKKGPHRRLSIRVKFDSEDKSNTPFPKTNKPYKRVLNAGSKSNPDYTLDRDGLVQTQKDWNNSAPISLLEDRSGDHYQDIFNYDTDWREAAKMKAQREKCLQKYPYDEETSRWKQRKIKKEYEKCVESAKPDSSLRDRLYRFRVH